MRRVLSVLLSISLVMLGGGAWAESCERMSKYDLGKIPGLTGPGKFMEESGNFGYGCNHIRGAVGDLSRMCQYGDAVLNLNDQTGAMELATCSDAGGVGGRWTVVTYSDVIENCTKEQINNWHAIWEGKYYEDLIMASRNPSFSAGHTYVVMPGANVELCKIGDLCVTGDFLDAECSAESGAKECVWVCIDNEWIMGVLECNDAFDEENKIGVIDDNNADVFEKCVAGTPVAGAACVGSDLPALAATAHRVQQGGKLVCWADTCVANAYLVIDSGGASQGRCVDNSYCAGTPNTHLNIIDGTKTDLQCVANDEIVQLTDSASSAADGANANPCAAGTAGYVMFDGECVTVQVRDEILRQRQAQQNAAHVASLTGVITKNKQALNEIMAGFDVSVWRNDQGKFNTARLLSDSVAGVVLGTAGGLITNKIIKKNQIDKSLDGIKCTVGGQAVADWGDEFIIGR